MKKLLGIIAAVLTGGAAHAGSVTFVEIAEPVIAAPVVAQPWSGLYAGGHVAFSSADGLTELIPSLGVDISNIRFDMTGTGYGGFVGYNIQRGAFVFGGEAAITLGGLTFDDPDFALTFGNIIDLKARAGFTVGNALIYGVVGGAFATMSYQGFDFPSKGLAYGAGVEMSLGEHLFVGGEYLLRGLTGTNPSFPAGSSVSANINSAQLRVGWRF